MARPKKIYGIVHLQIPHNDSNIQDDFAISPRTCAEFMNFVKETLGDRFVVIMSPMNASMINSNIPLINISGVDYTSEQLIDIVQKNKMSK